MDPVGFIVVFIISWWLSFFCVLPIGVQGQFEDNGDVVEGSEAGAPKRPMLKKKVIWASLGGLGRAVMRDAEDVVMAGLATGQLARWSHVDKLAHHERPRMATTWRV